MVFRGHAGARESVGFYRSLFGEIRFDVDDQVTDHGIVLSRFRDGRIIEDYSVTDSLELPRALGLARTVMLGIDIARGRVQHPRGAQRRSRLSASPSRTRASSTRFGSTTRLRRTRRPGSSCSST